MCVASSSFLLKSNVFHQQIRVLHFVFVFLAWLGLAWLVPGLAWLGLFPMWLGLAWFVPSLAWLGLAWLDLAWSF